MNDIYVIKEGKKLRCGYTTGSCAAAAAKACAMMLFKGESPENVSIDTRAGFEIELKIDNHYITHDYVSCSVLKDAGDDPDITDKIEVYVKMSKRNDNKIVIDGGQGVGRIKRKGLFGEVGEAAINPVPREMIRDEVLTVTDNGVDIVVYVPKGEEIGKKTFNGNIGIEGGISIIGTTGIVYPMSEEAFKKSIYLEVDLIANETLDSIILYPGNYGERAIEEMKLQGGKVKISNFIGDTLLYCCSKGFKKIIIVGHIGKLSKVSIGAFNTHSRVCDARIEAFVYYLAMEKAPYSLISRVDEALTSEEALKTIIDEGYGCIVDKMKQGCIDRVKRYVKDEKLEVEVIMYSMEYGVL